MKMIENLLVVLIVAAAVVWLVRRLRRLSKGEVTCPGCDGECSIPCAEKGPFGPEETPGAGEEAQGERR